MMADDHHKRNLLVKQLLPSKTSLGSLDWVVMLVKENAPHRETIYSGRCDPVLLCRRGKSPRRNPGMLSTLTCADTYKRTIWEPWDQPPNPQRGHGTEPDADLASPELRLATARQDPQPRSGQGLGGLGWRHRCSTPNGAQGLQPRFTTLSHSTKSLTQLSLLQSNPRNRRNRCDFTDGYFPVRVPI